MHKKTLSDITCKGNRVLMRVDFNVPLDDQGNITNDKRIVEALPSIRKIVESGGRLILMSHLGRPKGKPVAELSLAPVAKRLSELLDTQVVMAEDCIGTGVMQQALALQDGEVMLLENLRFHPEEEKNDPEFAKELASLGEAYVNDAFGTAHRAHASTEGICHFVQPSVAGFLIEKELKYLGRALQNPERPFVAILGGAKISGKIDVLENLFGKVDAVLVGGAMIFTFFRTMGYDTGKSLVEEDKLELASRLLKKTGGQQHPLAPPDGRGRRDRVLRRSRNPHGGRRLHPRRHDGTGHRPKDHRSLLQGDSAGKNGRMERPDGRIRAGAVR